MADSRSQPARWIRFLRQYGPIPRNENMYDEHIRRSARRSEVQPIEFAHPASTEVLEAITGASPVSVVLTGTAGDGKTHLCRQVWEMVAGNDAAWQSPEPYLSTALPGPGGGSPSRAVPGRTLHVVRDLSAWVPQREAAWEPEAEELLTRFSSSLFPSAGDQPAQDIFLIAGNDGQLMETWRRLGRSEEVRRARDLFETLLVEDRQEFQDVSLRFVNLSQYESAALLDRALDAFVGHDAWNTCRELDAKEGEFFGPECPIRHNLELLHQPLVQQRLRDLLALCDHNGLHMPIRQILLLLVNAILGHAGAKDGLMTAADVPGIIRDQTVAKANFYDNIFGGNLSETRRARTPVFDALDRLGVGHETSNRVDNILIFGDTGEALRAYFDRYMTADRFYGATASYQAAQRAYVEGADESPERRTEFLRMLVAQRRGLFFKIPDAEADEMHLWDLTVFRYAGEYLGRVVAVLNAERRVDRPILWRLVIGLNRIFTGMLVSDDQHLLLASSLAPSQGRVSRLFVEQISAAPHLGERVEIDMHKGDHVPVLEVTLSDEICCAMPLHLTRYEFLSRVADGALPGSFSRECYEDLLAFKSQLLAAVERRRTQAGETPAARGDLAFSLLQMTGAGRAERRLLELRET
jgi:hypothetical protein